MLGCKALYDQLLDSATVPEVAKSALAVAEYRIADAGKTLGIQTNGAEEIEERHAGLRAANTRVAELEAQLGATGTAQQTQAQLKRMGKLLNQWWDLEGFGHISKMRFSENGHVEVEFSCSLFGIFRLVDSPSPISDQEQKVIWYAQLKERGFELVSRERGREMAVKDCDISRATLDGLFRQTFPSARMVETENHIEDGVALLRAARVYIYDLADITALAAKLENAETL